MHDMLRRELKTLQLLAHPNIVRVLAIITDAASHPLGFVMEKKGGSVNFNYYDSPALQQAVTPFIEKCMESQLSWPICRDEVFCLGTGKNKAFLEGLNEKHGWFKRVVPLEHPRYIMQYKSSQVDAYIAKYLLALGES